MTLEDIHRFAATLPAKAPLFDTVKSSSGSRRQHEADRRNAVEIDPAFGWHFVRTLVDGNYDLPRSVDNIWIIRAYQYELFGVDDPVIEQAIALDSQQLRRGALLKACFIDAALTLEDAAQRLNVPIDVVTAFHELFWNVKDRIDEHIYISHLVWPETRMVEDMRGYLDVTSPEIRVIRNAYHNGIDSAFAVYGTTRRPFEAVGDLGPELANQIKARALLHVNNGMLNHQSRVIDKANTLLSSSLQAGNEQNGKNEKIGLECISESVYKSLQESAPLQVREKMQAYTQLLNAKNITPAKT